MLELTGLSLSQVLATLGAFGAAVLVLYLLKLRRRPVEVPFVRLWHDVLAEQRTTRLFSSLKRLLSLLLALFVVATLAVALGDPRWVTGREDGRTFVVLVDVSASMGASDVEGGRIEAAREAVRRRIAAMGADDRMIVAAMGASTVPLGPVEGDHEVLEEALSRLEARDVAADLARGLGWALDVARGAGSPEIVIVSDGRLTPPGEVIEARAEGVPVRWDRIGTSEPRNVAITAFAVRRYPIDKSRAQVLIELWNPGPNAEEVELTLLGDSHEGEGVPLDVTTIRLGAGERAPRLFENVTGADRTLEARIRLADGSQDDLAADDRAFARLPERRRARVLVVAEDDIYLEAALLLDEYLVVTHVTPAQYPPAERDFDVVIYESFVPAQPLDAPAIWLHPLPAEGVTGPLVVDGTIPRPFFDRLERDHPLLAFTSLRDVNIAEALRVRTEPGDVVVGADARGPLLVTGTRDGRGFVALTFDPRRSDLPLRVAWPLLLLHAIDSFVEEASGHFSSYRTGEPWYVPVSPEATSATLIAPDGATRALPIVGGRAVASGERAGFYRVTTDAGDDEILAADLGPSGEAELAVASSMPIAGEPSAPPAIIEAPVRGEPWVWLAVIAFAVLAIEWVTFHRRWTV